MLQKLVYQAIKFFENLVKLLNTTKQNKKATSTYLRDHGRKYVKISKIGTPSEKNDGF